MSESGSRQWLRELPEDLELMAPGPQLALLLSSVDRRALSSEDRIRLVQARNRLIAHQQAELLTDMYAVSRDEQPSSYRDGREASRYPWAEVELAFALSWTRTAAGYRLEQARQLIEDLPVVHAKLAAGEIDLPKAYVIADLADWLGDVTLARQVVDKVIDKAPRLTTGQLRARLRRLVLAVDPDAARRRCEAAVRTRRVESLGNPDGTGEVWGRSLPAQDAAAVWERLTAIARSAKTAGDGRSVDQLRADALLDLLVGEGVAAGGPVGCHTGGLPDAGGSPEYPPAVEPDPVPAPHDWDPAWPVEPSPQLETDQLATDPAVLPPPATPHRWPRPVPRWWECLRGVAWSTCRCRWLRC